MVGAGQASGGGGRSARVLGEDAVDALVRGSVPMDTTPGGWTAMRTWRLSILAASFTVVMTGTGFSADTVRVFRYDGSLQCGMGQAVPLDDMAKELTAVNIKCSQVRSESCRVSSSPCVEPRPASRTSTRSRRMIFREYRLTHRESRDFSPGCMRAPHSKSRSMTEACNVKWVNPCHWTKWRRSCTPRASPSRPRRRRRMGFNTHGCAERRRAR